MNCAVFRVLTRVSIGCRTSDQAKLVTAGLSAAFCEKRDRKISAIEGFAMFLNRCSILRSARLVSSRPRLRAPSGHRLVRSFLEMPSSAQCRSNNASLQPLVAARLANSSTLHSLRRSTLMPTHAGLLLATKSADRRVAENVSVDERAGAASLVWIDLALVGGDADHGPGRDDG